MGSVELTSVEVELAIVIEELEVVGVWVPHSVIRRWSIGNRSRAEQWAIRKRWLSLSHPPCPVGHRRAPGPIPAVVKRWLRHPRKEQSDGSN